MEVVHSVVNMQQLIVVQELCEQLHNAICDCETKCLAKHAQHSKVHESLLRVVYVMHGRI